MEVKSLGKRKVLIVKKSDMGSVIVEYLGFNAIYFVHSVFPYRFFFDLKKKSSIPRYARNFIYMGPCIVNRI